MEYGQRSILFVVLFLFVLSANCSIAKDVYADLTNLSTLQQEQLSKLGQEVKTNNDAYEQRIIELNTKLNNLDRTAADYTRKANEYKTNIAILKGEQAKFQIETDQKYQEILNKEQYKQYTELQNDVQDAFNTFLKD